MEARLILHGSYGGPWNMAVDETLLRWVAEQGKPCLRFYQWSPPCLSLGYFQSTQDRLAHPPSSRVPYVRRPTGGGAIVHHFELTYSLLIPDNQRGRGESFQWYRIVHQAAVDILKQFGVHAQLIERPGTHPTASHFLCFLRRATGDVVCENTKVLGSAQRRWRNALLQHGSLIFQPSPFAPEVLGLMASLDRLPNDIRTWTELWSRSIGNQLGCRWTVSDLTDGEHAHATELMRTKYGTSAWNARR